MVQTPTRSSSRSAQQQAAHPAYVISEQDKKRVEKVAAAWCAYYGELEEPLQRMPGQPRDSVLSNRMQAIVDRGVDFLFGKEIEIAVEESAPEQAQDLLNTVWGRKEARIPLLQKLAMNGAIAGQAFLRIVPSASGNFRLIVVDPAIVYMQTAQQDCETVLLYCIEYCCDEPINGKPQRVYYREEIARNDPQDAADDEDVGGYEDLDADGWDSDVTWTIQHWTRIGDRGNWQPSGQPIHWEYPFAPLFHCQNLPRPNDVWGIPDITPDLIQLNVALNLVQSSVSRIQKLYGSPILYATGTGEQVIDIKPGRIIGLPTTESKIVAVPLASDTANALIFAQNIRSDIDELSSTPGVATGRIEQLPRGNMSGIAIELLFMPLLTKTNKKRALYGHLLLTVSKALLALSKIDPQTDISIAWQNPLPAGDLQSVQASVLLSQLGVSKTTIQRDLGFDPEEELQLTLAEQAQEQEMEAETAPLQSVPPAPTGQPQPGQAPQPQQAQAPGQPSQQQQGGPKA